MAANGDVMADIEKTLNDGLIPNIPACNLKYGTVNEISMILCTSGPLKNWRHVAGELGFKLREISGHFENFSGCDPAQNMLNEWIFKRGGTVPELVKVFKKLELYSCLEELFADKAYQSACEYFGSGKDKYDADSDDDSSGTSSICEESTNETKPDTPHASENKDGTKEEENKEINHQDPPTKEEEEEKKVIPEKKIETVAVKSSDSKPVISYNSWPDKALPYNRSTSVPPESVKTKRSKLIVRSISEDSGKTKQKEIKKKQKKHKLLMFASKLRWRRTKKSFDEVIQAEGHYQEAKPTEPTNLFPLEEAKIPPSVDRASSSGSEDSLPVLPSSPDSFGYGSGSECEVSDNQSKKIYIVCNPDEPKIFKKAMQLYIEFSKKGYECTLFTMNLDQIMEIGQYRYQMEQVKDSDFVFLCVSKELKEIFEQPSKELLKRYIDDNCKSLRHVSNFIMAHLSNQCKNTNGKFMSILLAEDSLDHIPYFMQTYLSYKWPEHEARMENAIHGRSEIPKIHVARTRVQATQKVFGPLKYELNSHKE